MNKIKDIAARWLDDVWSKLQPAQDSLESATRSTARLKTAADDLSRQAQTVSTALYQLQARVIDLESQLSEERRSRRTALLLPAPSNRPKQGLAFSYDLKMHLPAQWFSDSVVLQARDLPDGFRLEQGKIISDEVPVNGKFRLVLEGLQVWRSAELELNVLGDPRSMWTSVEPSPLEPYQAEHFAFGTGENARVLVDYASLRGRSHARDGKFREDAVVVQLEEGPWFVCAVSDGAGSARFSRCGSNELAQLSVRLVHEALAGERVETTPESARSLLASTLQDVHRRLKPTLEAHIDWPLLGDPKWPQDFYATLLLYARKTGDDGSTIEVAFQVGDGQIVSLNDEETFLGSADSGGHVGETEFFPALRDSDDIFLSRTSSRLLQAPPDLVFLMTDGVSDPWSIKPGAVESLKKFCTEVEVAAAGQVKQDTYRHLLETYHSGHHDDRSLIVIRSRTGGATK